MKVERTERLTPFVRKKSSQQLSSRRLFRFKGGKGVILRRIYLTTEYSIDELLFSRISEGKPYAMFKNEMAI